MTNPLKIHWLSNAPWGKSGYAVQTKLNIQAIQKLGYDVSMSANYGLEGGKLDWHGIPVYPTAPDDKYCIDTAPANAIHEQAQIIISLFDSWIFDPARVQVGGIKWIPWFPIDAEPIPMFVFERVNLAFDRIAMSKFGYDQMTSHGLKGHYVPHSVDTKVFYKVDRTEARERLKLPKDTFIVGMVAANMDYPSRKCFPEQIQAFWNFHQRHPDSVLLMHTNQGNGLNDIDLPMFLMQYGNQTCFLISNQYQYYLGSNDETMRDRYNAFNVMLSVSMGEGFGIPILESQACGTPVITGDWTSMSELCFAGHKVDKSDAVKFWKQQGAYQYLPRVEAIERKLELEYNKASSSERAVRMAAEYDVDLVAEKYWKPALEKIQQELYDSGVMEAKK